MKTPFARLLACISLIGLFGPAAASPGDGPTSRPIVAPARFQYAGHVVDESGRPISGVKVTATDRAADGRSFGYIDEVTTNAGGEFSIDRQTALSGATADGIDGTSDAVRLEFSHPDHEYGRLEDLRLIDADAATHLKVTLRPGRTVSGWISDVDALPVAAAAVEIKFGDRYELRKSTVADAKGHFELHGLPALQGTLNVFRAGPGITILTGEIPVAADDIDLKAVRAIGFDIPAGTAINDFCGMKLVDVTPAIQKAFHLGRPDGVLILDPGNRSDRLKIGELKIGDTFWMVGQDRVKNFAEFRQKLQALTKDKPDGQPGPQQVRVVYNFSRPDFTGSNTQSMELTEADIATLNETPSK